MKLFKQLWNSIQKSFVRFPASAILSVAACIFFSLAIHHANGSRTETVAELYRYKFLAFGLSSCWAILFSIVVQLISEIITDKHGSVMKRTLFFIAGQSLSIIIGLGPGYLFCRQTGDHYAMIYWGTLCMLAFLCPLLLSFFERKETVVPHIICSVFFSFFIATCVGLGLTVIIVAINSLLHELNQFDEVMEIVWVCSELLFYVNCFISLVTDKETPYTAPKFFKVIMLYVLFPLYLVLGVVLYGYLLKCLVTWSLPGGRINWFVSFATVFYLIFYFTLQEYKNKVTEFFFKFGSLFLVPLIITQIIAFTVRIQAYGFTPVRYVSMVYILFSIWCVVMSLVQKGKRMMLAFAVLSILCLLTTCTKFNMIDMPVREQSARMLSVLKKNNLIAEGKIIISSGDMLTKEDRAILKSTFDELSTAEKKPVWLSSSKETINHDEFKSLFGFEYDSLSVSKTCFIYSVYTENKNFNIAPYKTLYLIDEARNVETNGKKLIINANGVAYDITQFVDSNYTEINESASYEKMYKNGEQQKEPLLIHEADGSDLYLTEITVKANSETKRITYAKVKGFVCK